MVWAEREGKEVGLWNWRWGGDGGGWVVELEDGEHAMWAMDGNGVMIGCILVEGGLWAKDGGKRLSEVGGEQRV